MRAVLDPNVLISALLSPRGTPARIFRGWLDGMFELIVSPTLLTELERALGYPKLRRRIPSEDGRGLIELLARSAAMHDQPARSAGLISKDPGDDYLLALAVYAQAALVSGDNHLLSLDAKLPIHSPAEFIQLLEAS